MASDEVRAAALHEALVKATKCTRCDWRDGRSKGCRECLGPHYYTTRLTRDNLELLETLRKEGKSLSGFRPCVIEAAVVTASWQHGPLYVRSPARVPVLPTKELVKDRMEGGEAKQESSADL